MKSIKNIYYTVCLGLLSLGTSSCTDWLTLYPQNRVVEENFWEDKNDLEGVRYGAYKQMQLTMPNIAIWGDLRSDSYEENAAIQTDITTHNRYIDVRNGMPDSSMTFFDWSGVYTTINYCNKVLQHGDEVLAKDKQFTTSEWIQMRAEMTALRALNYFYLIRAFKDVPYTTKVINSDVEVEYFPLTNQLVVLDSIINDCERVKGKARNRFAQKRDSKGLITNSAIYAMLADMYLWRGALHEGRHGRIGDDLVNGVAVSHDVASDYELASLYADTCLQYLAKQNQEERASAGPSFGLEETVDYLLGEKNVMKNCDMIKNIFEGASQSTTPKLEAQQAIFQTKNSRESIFELQFRDGEQKNDFVNSLYGYSDHTHLRVNDDAIKTLYDGGISGEGDNGGMWDSRLWISCQNKLSTSRTSTSAQAQPYYYCMKYQFPSSTNTEIFEPLRMEGQTTGREIKSLIYTTTSTNNWIIYRMTDVMLIKAEALVCHANTNSASNAENKSAKAICNAIHRRSYCNYRNASKIPDPDATKENSVGNPKSESDPLKLVLNERQIELLGEGKRWFDLVRYAERKSYDTSEPDDPREPGVPNGHAGVKKMIKDFLGTGGSASYATTLENRMKNRYGLYCPIYEEEVKASNGLIQQNPVWNKSKYEQ